MTASRRRALTRLRNYAPEIVCLVVAIVCGALVLAIGVQP